MKFGPSGTGPKFAELGYKSTKQAPLWLKEQGLNAFEYSFGRGYTMSLETAKQIGCEAKKHGITISVHAPYFINLANPDQEKIKKSFSYILDGCQYTKLLGGNHLVIHVGSQMTMKREEALANVRQNLAKVAEMVREKFQTSVYLCLETMGKYSQIGTYEEILELCKIDDIFLPTFDFGHINCIMQGKLDSEKAFEKILQDSINVLGKDKISNCHIHFSKIEFSEKGEIKHLDYQDENHGPNFKHLAKVLIKLGLNPVIICESKTKMVEDAIKFQKIYKNLKKRLDIHKNMCYNKKVYKEKK